MKFIGIQPKVFIVGVATALAFVIMYAGYVLGPVAQAQAGGSWQSCILFWFGLQIGPPECGGPPPGSECYPGCTGPLGGFCPTDYCWSVWVPDPVVSCATVGAPCGPSAANACGDTAMGVYIDNAGTCECTATTPSVVDQCPSDAGTQCSVSDCTVPPSCVPNEGDACGSNACGDSGTVLCDGTCSIPSPTDVCPADSGLQCPGSTCSVGCDPATGTSCGANACGEPGAIQCDGSCAIPSTTDVCPADSGLQCDVSDCSVSCAPTEGDVCTRTNSCGDSNTGAILCSGACSVSAPPEASCPSPLPPPSLSITADRVQVRRGEIVRISWDANTSEAYNCVVYGPGVGPINFIPSVGGDSGAEDSDPISAKSVFTLECVEPVYGTVYTDSIIIETTGTIEER